MKTKEEIQAEIEVLENIGGYSIEIEMLKKDLNKSISMSDLQSNISIDFARWLWTHATPPSDFFNKWKYGFSEKNYSTKELFEIFKTKPNYTRTNR